MSWLSITAIPYDANLAEALLIKRILNIQETKYITAPTGRKNYMGEILQRKWWIPQKQVKFENTEFLVPADSHNYLLTLFGKNYMQLPPVEKREKHFIVKLKF